MIDQHELPEGWDKDIPVFPADAKGIATRDSSQKVLNAIAPHVPWLIGGAADLAPSTKSNLTFQGAGSFEPDNYGGRNMHFGIREHAMGAIVNGMALTGLRAYGSGFLIFSDYMKPPIRLAAIMELPVIYIFTHDCIGVGEDGPTHQPIEQLPRCAPSPGMITIRPGDANEVAEAWRVAMQAAGAAGLPRPEPPAAADARPHQVCAGDGRRAAAPTCSRDCERRARGHPDRRPAARCGSASAPTRSWTRRASARASSRMPSWELFEEQDQAYREQRAAAGRDRARRRRAGRRAWAGTATSASTAR